MGVTHGPGNKGLPSLYRHSSVVYAVMLVCLFLILGTILHEGGHATATCCAPSGKVRHIMLNPCCGGHAFVGHTGGELWEAWVSFAGPMWDISLAFLYYFIQTGVNQNGKAQSFLLYNPLSGVGLNVEETHWMDYTLQHSYLQAGNQRITYHQAARGGGLSHLQPGAQMEMSKHALEDSSFFWQVILTMLMDLCFITFVFNMLPIITLDGADFFGSWVRLCSTPMISAIFIICTSFICLVGMFIWRLLIPGIEIINNWDTYKRNADGQEQSPFAHQKVYMFLVMTIMVLSKLISLISPTIKLTCHACKDKLYKYHFTQDHEGKSRENARKRGGYDYMHDNQPEVVIQPHQQPYYGRVIHY